MNINFIWFGQSKYDEYERLIKMFDKRLKHYCKHTITILKDSKNHRDPNHQKRVEATQILSVLKPSDYFVLLDESGKSMSSRQLSQFLQKRMNASTNNVVFLIGGAYGVDQTIFDRANYILSLSKLTMTHDMARLLLLEQVYRGYTILRGEKYHND